MLLETFLWASLVSAAPSFTQILLSNQLQCESPYAMTVGVPQGAKEAVVRIEKGGKVLTEKKLGSFSNAEAAIYDLDESGCEEALIDVTSATQRMTLLVTFPKGKPAVAMYGPTENSASKAKRNRASVRVYEQRKGKLCIADYTIRKDAPVKTFEDCY